MIDLEKVLSYVIRAGANGDELLVFEHAGHPEAGMQVPAGTIEPGESAEQAAVRELREESGLSGLSIVGIIDQYAWQHPTTGNRHCRRVIQFDAGSGLPDTWRHTATGSAEEEGLIFCFRWITLAEAMERLACDQGRSLRQLIG